MRQYDTPPNAGRPLNQESDRLDAPGSPIDRAQALVEAQEGHVSGWSRKAHARCSWIASELAGLDHVMPHSRQVTGYGDWRWASGEARDNARRAA